MIGLDVVQERPQRRGGSGRRSSRRRT